MATPVEEEELRETYYIRCRNKGYTIDEASERSLAYIKRVFNADKSLTTTGYLEQLYQDSKSRPEYSSTPSSYDDDFPRLSQSSRKPRDGGRHDVFDDFSDMMDSLSTDRDSIFGDMRKQHEKTWSVPSYRAPEYVPSPYDYQNNAPKPRGESYGYAHSYDSFAPPRQSPYGPRSQSRSGSYYTREDRQPSSAYQYYASNSTYSSYPPLPPDYTFYSSSDSYTVGSSRSSRPGATPSYSYAQPSSHRPVTPPPQGIKPTTGLYTVLGLTRNATAAEIRKAHRAMSLKWHPDRCTEQDKKKATNKMAEINQANDVLCDEVKRRFYDRWGVLPSET